MRSLLFIFFLLSWGLGYSQIQKSSSSQDKGRSEEKAGKADAFSNDSVVLQEQTVRKKKELKKTEQKLQNTPARNAYGYEMEAADVEEVSQAPSAAYKDATINFEYSKKRSSVQRTQRSPSVSQQAEMDNAVGYFEENSPSSFEYHYFKYTAGNYDLNRYSHLKEAEKLRPNNSDVHVQSAAYHIIKGNKSNAIAYMDKLIASKRLNINVLKYAEDILHSVPKNGTLITHGFDDSYGAWYVQAAKGIRSDVNLISLDFLQSEAYRNELSGKGYKMPTQTKVDVNFLNQFCKLNSAKKLTISMTTPKEYLKPVLSNVYVTGLVFAYHSSSYNNFQRNVDLWEGSLKKELVMSANDEKSKRLSANYLPMLLQMRKVYKQQGNTKKVKELDATIDKIGVQCKKYDQVQTLKGAY